jgi:hypothetical protein
VPSSGRSPTFWGASVAGAAKVAEPQDTIEAQLTDEAVGGGGIQVIGVAPAVGAVAQEAIGGGSPATEVLPGGATNVTAEEVATDNPGSSSGSSGARLPPLKRPMTAASWSLRSS